MTSYNRFAEVYDQLMTDVPYQEYVEWIQACAPANTHPTLLDIGCGTGTMAELLVEAGYAVTGIDLSEEMLAIAAERLQQKGYNVPLFAMSMAELDGFEQIDTAIIPIDSINYVTSEGDVLETLKRVYESLRDGGQLLFDVHSLNYIENYLEGSPFTYDDEEVTYIWHTEEGDYEHSVYHQMTFFVANEDGSYERFDEEHFQRTFPIEHYKQMLEHVGFTKIELTADFTNEAPTEESSRIFIRAIK
jgi:ubiquinone/menaquinone biosynthesis C-methylase UbiE